MSGKDHPQVYEDRHAWRIGWYIAEDGEIGGTIGQDKSDGQGDAPTDRDAWEWWAACKAVCEMAPAVSRSPTGWYWESEREARAALRIVKEALRQDRPLPG